MIWLKNAPIQLSRTLETGPLPGQIAALMSDLRNYFLNGAPLSDHVQILDFTMLSEFQMAVYRVVNTIPHGESRTYSWVALRVGKPQAARAVGQALRRNPFPVVIPCHRVVAGKGLGGFMGISDPDQGEMILKSHLLETEKNYVNPMFSFVTTASGR